VSEDQFNLPPDLSSGCNFRWTTGRAYYRISNSNGFAWANADERGHAVLQPFMKDLLPNCPRNAGTPAMEAQLTTHYLEYTNQENRAKMMLPVGILSLATVGYAPFELNNYYVACVETNTPSGPRRAALAHGTLESFVNVWGSAETVLHPGGTVRRYHRENLLRDLTRQAWHKLWSVDQSLPAGRGCRETLDAMLK